MGNIDLNIYTSFVDYKKKKIFNTQPFNFTSKELIRYAISAGGFSNFSIGPMGCCFYESLVKMAVIEGKTFTIGDDYKFAETSIKTSISFFIGMIAAKAIADKKYNIRYLFHLKDPQVCSSNSGKTPDFFGLKNGTDPMLIEAKGTSGENISTATIIHAKNQLNSVSKVEIDGWNTTYSIFSKHIIGSSFINKNNNKILRYIDVDPNEMGDTKLTIYIDQAIIVYYQNIMNLLLTNEIQTKAIGKDKYVITKVGIHKLGLHNSIFEQLLPYELFFMEKPKNCNVKIPRGLYEQISKKSVEIPEHGTEYALSSDGILCV